MAKVGLHTQSLWGSKVNTMTVGPLHSTPRCSLIWHPRGRQSCQQSMC